MQAAGYFAVDAMSHHPVETLPPDVAPQHIITTVFTQPDQTELLVIGTVARGLLFGHSLRQRRMLRPPEPH